MEAVFHQLHAKHALRLPAGVSQDDPSLFAVSGQPTVQEVLHSVNHGRLPAEEKAAMPDTPGVAAADFKGPAPPTPATPTVSTAGQSHQQSNAAGGTPASAAGTPSDPATDRQQSQAQQPSASPFATAPDATASNAPAISAPHEHLQDTWVYRDPNWEVQGPFSKADILDWFEGGYFPADLPIKHASSPQADFKPLAAQIKVWAAAAPPGFARQQEPQNSVPAAAQPATPAQQAPVDQQPLSNAASGFQAQQQPQTDMNRAFTLTSVDSGIAHHLGPSTASSARIDALETGINQFSAVQPAQVPSSVGGMDFLNQLLRGNSGASSVAQSRPVPTQGQDPLAQFPGLQQGASAAAPWGHQAQPGPAPSGQFNGDSPLLGLVTGLGQDPFGQRQFNQPAQHQPPQQHALPAFLSGANHMQERASSLHQDKGIFGQPYAPQSSANLDHINLGSAGLNLQPHHQQQQWVSSCSAL